MTDEEKDEIRRAQDIQRYTENRCEALEKENKQLRKDKDVLTKVYNRQCSVVIELNVQLKSLKIVSQGLEKEIEQLTYNLKCLDKLEKENKSLGERVLQLQKDKGKLIDENRELQMKLLTLENNKQVITTTVSN